MPRAIKRSAPQAVESGGSRHEAPLPQFVRPQFSPPVEKPPSGPQWVHEIKLDGYRMAARIDNGQAQLLTRTGLDWTAKYPSVVAALSRLGVKTAYIDGELCGVSRVRRTRVCAKNKTGTRKNYGQARAASQPGGFHRWRSAPQGIAGYCPIIDRSLSTKKQRGRLVDRKDRSRLNPPRIPKHAGRCRTRWRPSLASKLFSSSGLASRFDRPHATGPICRIATRRSAGDFDQALPPLGLESQLEVVVRVWVIRAGCNFCPRTGLLSRDAYRPFRATRTPLHVLLSSSQGSAEPLQ
jgi:ATP dependent DNA ligase domain